MRRVRDDRSAGRVHSRGLGRTLTIQATDAITVLSRLAAVRSAGMLVRLPVLVGKRLAGLGLLLRREPLCEAATGFVELLRHHGARDRDESGTNDFAASQRQSGHPLMCRQSKRSASGPQGIAVRRDR